MGIVSDTMDNWWNNLTSEQQELIFNEYHKQFVAGDDYKKPVNKNAFLLKRIPTWLLIGMVSNGFRIRRA